MPPVGEGHGGGEVAAHVGEARQWRIVERGKSAFLEVSRVYTVREYAIEEAEYDLVTCSRPAVTADSG